MHGRSLLTLRDFSGEEIRYLIELSEQVKEEKRRGEPRRRFEGKSLALLFEKRSTRTRCAFETAFGEEGGHPVFLSNQDIHLGAKETVEDTARVLGRMFDAIQFRGFSQETVETLSSYAEVPVYNGLTDLYHPTQALADLLTLKEERGTLSGCKLVYTGDGRNNVARSLLVGCAKVGVDLTIAAPASLAPEQEIVSYAQSEAEAHGASVRVTEDVEEAVADADAIYTDVWVSMGQESESADRMELLAPYRVDANLIRKSGKNETVFLHCLPAVRGNEVTDEVMDGPASRVWDQAENRKHTIKALMVATLTAK
jgi:ornithine carbamoyltransferase